MKIKNELMIELYDLLYKHNIKTKLILDDDGDTIIKADLTDIPEIPYLVEFYDFNITIRNGLTIHYKYKETPNTTTYANIGSKLLTTLIRSIQQ